MDNKKKIIYILSIIGLALFAVLLFLLFDFFGEKSQSEIINNKLELSEDIETKESTKSELVKTRKSLEETLSLTKQAIAKQIEASPKNIAEVYLTVEQCSELIDDQEKDRCVTLWAQHAKDPEMCDLVSPDSKNQCLNIVTPLIALENKDLSLCETINDGAYRQSCVYKVAVVPSSSTSVCDSLSLAEDKEYCQFFITMKTKGTVSECQSIENVEIRDKCVASFY